MLKNQRSFHATSRDDRWVTVDAAGQTLGRCAAEIAFILMGKHKATYTPSTVMGDFVVVTNADKLKITGRKLDQKTYYSHSLHPGHLKETSMKQLLEKKPGAVLVKAVKGMLPANKTTKVLMTRLKVYTGSEHPHKAQGPTPLTLTRRKAV